MAASKWLREVQARLEAMSPEDGIANIGTLADGIRIAADDMDRLEAENAILRSRVKVLERGD